MAPSGGPRDTADSRLHRLKGPHRLEAWRSGAKAATTLETKPGTDNKLRTKLGTKLAANAPPQNTAARVPHASIFHSRGLRPLPPTPRKRWSLHVPGDAQEARRNFGLRDRQLDPPRISCSFPEGTRGSFPYEFQLETPDPHRCLCVHLSFKRGRPFRGPKLVSKRVRSASLETENALWETMGEPPGAQKEK